MGCVSGRPEDLKKPGQNNRTSAKQNKEGAKVSQTKSAKPADTDGLPQSNNSEQRASLVGEQPQFPPSNEPPLEPPENGVKTTTERKGADAFQLRKSVSQQRATPQPISRQQILKRYSLKVKDTSHRTPTINSYQYETMLGHNPSMPDNDPALKKSIKLAETEALKAKQ